MADSKFKQMTAKPFTFMFGRQETGYDGIGGAGKGILDGLMPYIEAHGIRTAGPGVWSYEHLGGGKVLLRAGIGIEAGPQSQGGYTVTLEPEWKCASMEYPGSMAGIAAAWEGFMAAVKEAGLVPTQENREIYHVWKGMDSPGNRTELQLRLE